MVVTIAQPCWIAAISDAAPERRAIAEGQGDRVGGAQPAADARVVEVAGSVDERCEVEPRDQASISAIVAALVGSLLPATPPISTSRAGIPASRSRAKLSISVVNPLAAVDQPEVGDQEIVG